LITKLDIFDPLLLELFAEVDAVLKNFNLDYFLTGAIARDIQLLSNPSYATRRKTNDIDIAVLIDSENIYHDITAALIATGNFEASDHNPIKLIYNKSIELDLLPFGAIENEERILHLNKGVVSLDMNGFKEVYPFIQTHLIGANLELKVCSLEGLILLKLISNHDNPSRTKDITDIEHLITVYFDLNSEDIYNNYFEVMEMYQTPYVNYLLLVSARIIGRKINGLITETTGAKENITKILSRRQTEIWQAMLEGLND